MSERQPIAGDENYEMTDGQLRRGDNLGLIRP